MAFESERWRCDVGGRALMCSYCAYRDGIKLSCKAFPDGIPRGILDREEHDTPYPGDNGYRFKPREDYNRPD